MSCTSHTTLNRWALVSDPGPDGWAPVGASDVDDEARDWWRALIHETPLEVPVVTCGAVFVVGDPAVQLPFGAMILTVREQIAKVTALVTNEVWAGWAEPVIGHVQGGRSRVESSDDWHEVVRHFDRRVTPHQDLDPEPLRRGLVEAFDAHTAAQFDDGQAYWVGSGDASRFTCEVPYGPGPYHDGAVYLANPSREPDVVELSEGVEVVRHDLAGGVAGDERAVGCDADGADVGQLAELLSGSHVVHGHVPLPLAVAESGDGDAGAVVARRD